MTSDGSTRRRRAANSRTGAALRAWVTSRRTAAALAAVVALACAARRAVTPGARSFTAPEGAIAAVFAARGLACDVDDVVWVARPDGIVNSLFGRARALVRAGASGEPRDLYFVSARMSPEGTILSVGSAWNVTNTSGVDESRPVVHGRWAFYTTSDDGLVTGLHLLDLEGGPPEATRDFSRIQRMQAALTNLQQTGQTCGVAHTVFAFDPVARQATAAWSDDEHIVAQVDGHEVVVDARSARVVDGQGYVRVVPDERARPGSVIPWAVDRVRALPWFGDDRMQWLKAVAFTAFDRLQLLVSNRTTVEDVRGELGIAASTAAAGEPTFTDPDVGWPPAPISPPVSPPLPGEGQWIALDHDPFITPSPAGSPPAFVTTFLRPDPHRPDVRVYVTLWDPRQIELHIEAGTVEPVSANGEHGPGLVPRTPESMAHFVAAFNGGFQAQHGEYGMQADGIEYLPPKPYAATVLELRDGSNAFGAWPNAPEVPSDAVAYRQNLTALVQGGKYNPWGRTWWGGTPPGWADHVHSTRSAICLTSDGFVGYFYSASISADVLADGMIAARCSFGIHLDMNPGHAGFEFYDVAPASQLKPLGRPLQPSWEAEGEVPELPGYAFRARRMIRGMGHMLFPRYIHRESRDFFYLTTRALLPGPPVPAVGARAPGEGLWQTKGLPQHGFPYAVATSWVRLDAAPPDAPRDVKAYLLRVDPRTLAAAPPADAAPADPDATVVAWTASARGSVVLWHSERAFVVSERSPEPGATALLGGHPLDDPRASAARAAAGIEDEDGMLVWVELAGDVRATKATAAAMDALLARMGCSTRIGIPGEAHALLGERADIAGHPAAPADSVVARLVRAVAPGARAIFTDTPIVPASVWQPLQAKRVRYFYRPAPASSSAASAAPASRVGGF